MNHSITGPGGRGQPFADLEFEEGRLARTLFWIAAAFCTLPTLMIALGGGFSSHPAPVLSGGGPQAEGMLPLGLQYRHISGAFTHTILEWGAFCVAALLGTLAFLYYRLKRDVVALVIGSALLLGGIVDLLHVLAFSRFLAHGAAIQGAITLAWTVGRTAAASILIASVLVMLLRGGQAVKRKTLQFVGFAGLVLVFLTYLAIRWLADPQHDIRSVLPGEGRMYGLLTRPWDGIPLLLFLLAGTLIAPALHRRYKSAFSLALWIAMLPAVAVHAHMAFGSVEAFDGHFNIAHSLKIVALLIPLLGLLLDFNLHFRREAQARARLLSRADDLELAVTARTNELRRLQLRSASIVASIPSGLVVLGQTGSARPFEVNSANANFREIFDLGDADLRGLDLDELLRVAGIPEEKRGEILRAAPAESAEWECRISKSPPRHVTMTLTSMRSLQAGKERNERLLIANDVTENKILEERLRQAERLEAIGRLAGGVAHDFNNLLMVINGYAQMILKQVEGQKALEEQASEVVRSGERAATLTRQLLAFSRQQVLEPQAVDINAVLEDMEKMLRRLIGENIDIVSVRGKDLGMIQVDPGQLEQVIMNLVVNARDAMPKNGKILIETSNLELEEGFISEIPGLDPGDYVVLSISDNGEGMDAETKAKIFEPFFTTKELGRGTGLGLATVHGVVKQSGGHIEVQSELARGTTFKIFFRRLEQPELRNRVQRPPVESLQGSERILLVEDDKAVRTLIEATLAESGYEVVSARDGVEALSLAKRNLEGFELLLTDLILPRMGGIEVAKKVTTLYPWMGVIYMSGYTKNAFVQSEGLEEEIAFLQKPFSPRDLLERIRQVLQHAQLATASPPAAGSG